MENDQLYYKLINLYPNEKTTIDYKGLKIVVRNRNKRIAAKIKSNIFIEFSIWAATTISCWLILIIILGNLGRLADIITYSDDILSYRHQQTIIKSLSDYALIFLIISAILGHYVSSKFLSALYKRQNKEIWNEFIKRYALVIHQG